MHSRIFCVLLAGAALLPGACWSAPRHKSAAKQEKEPAAASPGPKALGHFGDWTAATYQHEGQTVCYAFTRARSVGQDEGGGSGPLLTVTERPTSRDEVAITGGPAYPKDGNVLLQAGQSGIEMYTSGHDAFARDPKAAVAALRHNAQAIARSPSHGADTFSLQGFTQAYEAIVKACPAK